VGGWDGGPAASTVCCCGYVCLCVCVQKGSVSSSKVADERNSHSSFKQQQSINYQRTHTTGQPIDSIGRLTD
jgi:hypothetical protein